MAGHEPKDSQASGKGAHSNPASRIASKRYFCRGQDAEVERWPSVVSPEMPFSLLCWCQPAVRVLMGLRRASSSPYHVPPTAARVLRAPHPPALHLLSTARCVHIGSILSCTCVLLASPWTSVLNRHRQACPHARYTKALRTPSFCSAASIINTILEDTRPRSQIRSCHFSKCPRPSPMRLIFLLLLFNSRHWQSHPSYLANDPPTSCPLRE
ncbi:hypothetical protein DFH27DRAFT_206990 [Peziza echinospora]|nr:hypothetical protein DFH27DRAFT_206990 [Peziza echinospora]